MCQRGQAPWSDPWPLSAGKGPRVSVLALFPQCLSLLWGRGLPE